MQRNIKLAIAAAILIAGLATALMFRRPLSTTADSGAAPAEQLPYRAATSRPAATAGTEAAAAAPPDAETALAPWSTSPAGSPLIGSGSVPTAGEYDTVPALPSQYEAAGSRPAPTLPPPPATGAPAAPVFPAAPPSGPSTAAAGVPNLDRVTVSLQAPLRTHRIVDGDTLGRIAADYLGDTSRQNEILELNGETLGDNPELLPIGAVLKIPAAAPATDRQSGSAADAVDAAELVPIPAGALRRR